MPTMFWTSERGKQLSSLQLLRRQLLESSGQDRLEIVGEMIDVIGQQATPSEKTGQRVEDAHREAGGFEYIFRCRDWGETLAALMLSQCMPTMDDWRRVFRGLSKSEWFVIEHKFLQKLVKAYGKITPHRPITDRDVAESLEAILRKFDVDTRPKSAPTRRLLEQLRAMVGDTGSAIPVVSSGEAWSDLVLADLAGMDEKQRAGWRALLLHAGSGFAARPSGKWSKRARELVEGVGTEKVRERLTAWFPLVDRPRTAVAQGWLAERIGPLFICDRNMEVLKGLCWVAAEAADGDLTRALGKLVVSAYRKVPGVGPRAVKVGNAAVGALGEIPGPDALGQLAMLGIKVKFGTAQKLIEKALGAAAARAGLPRGEIDELAVPTYGLEGVGVRREEIAGHRAELRVSLSGGGKAELTFFKPGGKAGEWKLVKSAPAALKAEGAAELKELKAAAKDAGAMVSAQRARIDSLFMENRTWAAEAWRQRYLDHPLVGVVARRLIWRLSGDEGTTWRSATWSEEGGGGMVGADGARVDGDWGGTDGRARLWHPLEATQDEVLAWRAYFEERRVKQPFKQAHREIYLLTDAERATGTYSNRFAAHVVRQHQFNALVAARNWKHKTRLAVDQEFPPATRALPAWGLRAEFWVDGLGEDMNEAGTFLYLGTDQVRFYRAEAGENMSQAGGGTYVMRSEDVAVNRPLAMEEIPALALSEVLRDVDLFVGVASVGNNPQWNDGGPEGRFRDYWWDYGFGELAEAGKNRHELLSRLVPRLAIGRQCELTDKFLVVRGSLRTYKIHLGSGNILMSPDDQYLCIVADRSGAAGRQAGPGAPEVFLPFEGDRTLSLILSKAILLAADETITDATITKQIKGRE